MKSRNILTFIFVGLLVISATTSGDFIPEDGRVISLLYVDTDDASVLVGSSLTFDVVVKNLTNNSISNITITQQIPEDLDLISVMGQSWDGIPHNYTGLSVSNTLGTDQLSVRYLNITQSNFTTNIDTTIASGHSLGLQFLMEANQVTGNAPFSAPQITYYDHWNDRYTGQPSSPAFILEATTSETDPKLSYIPEFDTTETDYNLILGLTAAVTAAALLGRILYVKKPIEL